MAAAAGARQEVRAQAIARRGGGRRLHPVALEEGVADDEARALCILQVGGGQREGVAARGVDRSEEHTSELQSPCNLVCRLLLEKKKKNGILSEQILISQSEKPSSLVHDPVALRAVDFQTAVAMNQASLRQPIPHNLCSRTRGPD